MRRPSTSIPLDLAVFRPSADFAQRPRPLSFAPGSRLDDYDPNEERSEHGRWTSGGGGPATASGSNLTFESEEGFPAPTRRADYAMSVDLFDRSAGGTAGWVAKHVETSRRRDVLTFGHHKAVARFRRTDGGGMYPLAGHTRGVCRETQSRRFARCPTKALVGTGRP